MQQIDRKQFEVIVNTNEILSDYHIITDVSMPLKNKAQVSFYKFTNCHFLNANFILGTIPVSFINCTFEKLSWSLENYIGKVSFEDCKFLRFESHGNANVGEELVISGSSTEIGNLVFSKVAFHTIIFDGIKRIDKATLDLQSQYFTLNNVDRVKNLTLKGQVTEEVVISKCNNFNFFVVDSLKGKRFDCSDSIDLTFELDSLEFKYVNFYRNKNLNISLNYVVADSVGLHEGDYHDVEITHECNFNLVASRDVFIRKLSLASVHILKDKKIDIEDVSIQKLIFEGVHNEGLISITNCRIQDLLRIVRTSVAKCNLSSMHLDKECRVDILDSNVSDVQFNSFKWNAKYRLFENFDPKTEASYKSKSDFQIALRESYRQLKNNYQKNGNKIEALEFQKNEMNIHYALLSEVRLSSLRNFGNYLIVGTNKWFSDFGQNIWKPLVWLFFSHLIVFNMILYFNDFPIEFARGPRTIDWSTTAEGVALYFHTLLPTHPFVIPVKGTQGLSIIGFWDFASRVLSGYFIYYFISASRKYHQ